MDTHKDIIYVVIPHFWDTLYGDVVIFSSLENAKKYIATQSDECQYTINARYIDQPKKKLMVEDEPREWEEHC